MTIEALRTPDERFANLPDWNYSPHYVDDLPGFEGLRMHYVDEGPADGVVFLCLHGEPSWGYLYRKMMPVFLAAGHRVVAPDMFGFGRSDKPLDDAVYGYHFHRNSLLRLVERLDLKNVCQVVQDWGGLLGLTMPLLEPERYTRLIVMNTGLPDGRVAMPGFAAWRAYNRSQPDLAVGKLLQRGTAGMTDDEAAAYDAPFPDGRYKGGVRRFPELVMLRESEDDELTESSREGLDTSLAATQFWRNDWQGESFMAYGMQDPVFSLDDMLGLQRTIRNCPEPMQVAEGGHFVQEHGGPIAQAALRAFGLS